jgi:hypothetical protein
LERHDVLPWQRFEWCDSAGRIAAVEEAADEAVVGDNDPGGPFLVDADVEQTPDWPS